MTGLRKLSILALALPFAAAASEPAGPAAPAPRPAWRDCPAQDGEPQEAPLYSRYPSPPRVERWVAPVLATRQARRYRSTLGAEVANGPNFAGDYTLAAWGCGNSCTQIAIVAAQSGRVFFPPQLRTISTQLIGNWDGGRALRYRGLRFCRASRLVAVVGRREGGGAQDGVTYFEWRANGLHHVPVPTGPSRH